MFCRGTGSRMEAALKRDRVALTGLMRRAGRPVCDEGSNPSVRNDRSRVSELRVEQRERRVELVETGRGVSSFVRDVERPVFDWTDPVLKRVVARGDTWRDAIAEHGILLGRAIGANRRNGDEGKALVRWMEEQTGHIAGCFWWRSSVGHLADIRGVEYVSGE